MRPRLLLLALLLPLSACTQDAAPTTTSEAQFTVNPGGGNDRGLLQVQLSAGNASHVIDMPADIQAPYMFFMENAFPPVQGVIVPVEPAGIDDFQLLFGGETVPRIVSDPADNSEGCPVTLPPTALCVNNCEANMRVPCVRPEPGPVEVRFDVVATPVTLFQANVGSINQDHIVSAALTPATIFLEEAKENASGVFTKFDPTSTLTVTLIIDGVVRDTGTSPQGSSNDAIVQYQFD